MTEPVCIHPDDCDDNAHFVHQGNQGICVCDPGYTGDGFQCEGKRFGHMMLQLVFVSCI